MQPSWSSLFIWGPHIFKDGAVNKLFNEIRDTVEVEDVKEPWNRNGGVNQIWRSEWKGFETIDRPFAFLGRWSWYLILMRVTYAQRSKPNNGRIQASSVLSSLFTAIRMRMRMRSYLFMDVVVSKWHRDIGSWGEWTVDKTSALSASFSFKLQRSTTTYLVMFELNKSWSSVSSTSLTIPANHRSKSQRPFTQLYSWSRKTPIPWDNYGTAHDLRHTTTSFRIRLEPEQVLRFAYRKVDCVPRTSRLAGLKKLGKLPKF